MNVLSLFDGMACGIVALKRLGVKIDNYYASEIEPNAIKVACANNPEIIEVGDICNVSYKDGVLYTEKGNFEVGHIDLIMGGSPCTNFSSIGYAKGMVAGETEILSLEQYLALKKDGCKFEGQSYLFWEYVRLIHEVQADYFLLENVVMAKKWEHIITSSMGVTPIKINSSLVSAQNRPRLYWTNIENVSEPKDCNIMLSDILSSNACTDDVFHCLTVQRSFPKMEEKYGYIPERFNAYNATELRDKACALSRGSMVTSSCATLLFIETKDGKHTVKGGKLQKKYKTNLSDGMYNIRKLSLLEMERLQTLPDNYTDIKEISNQKKSEMIGNGWTVDVIAHILSFLPEVLRK